MSLAELTAYARRHHLSVRLAIEPGDADKPTRLSELTVCDGHDRNAEEIEGIYLRPSHSLDYSAKRLLELVKHTTVED